MKNLIPKRIIYISGPITDINDGNRQAFKNMEEKLVTEGHNCINPRAKGWKETDIPEGMDLWIYMMKLSLREMMNCDAIILLKGWEDSKGAKIERQLALDLAMPIYFEETF